MRRLTYLLVTLLLWGTPVGAAPCQERQLVTELGQRVSIALDFPMSSDVVRVPPSTLTGTRYIRIRIDARDFECPWHLTVRDEQYHVLQTLTAEDFRVSRKRWTVRIPGGRAIFDLQRCPGAAKPTLRFDEYIWMPEKAQQAYYSIQGTRPAYKDLFGEENGLRRLGDSIGLFMSSWANRSWVCSGAMVAADLFLTNWHCGGPEWIEDPAQPGVKKAFREDFYWQDPILADALIDLSFDGDKLSREYMVSRVAASRRELDFAILEVQPLDTLGPARPFPIRRLPPVPGDAVRVVHHPEGKQKQITIDCPITGVDYPGWKPESGQVDLTHRCDTEGGSSGAPLLGPGLEIVGLHHLGFKVLDSVTCTEDRLSKAVRMDKILEVLESEYPEVYARLTIR